MAPKSTTGARPVKRVSIRELHEHTGAVVREAASAGNAVVITDRGRPVATMAPWEAHDERRAFRDRELSPAFQAVQRKKPVRDSSADISADRDR